MSNKKPEQIKAVEAALIVNGKEAGLSRKLACYTYFDNDEWLVGSNFEGGFETIIFRAGEWFTRCPHTGEDRKMRGGFEEALANARIAYTG